MVKHPDLFYDGPGFKETLAKAQQLALDLVAIMEKSGRESKFLNVQSIENGEFHSFQQARWSGRSELGCPAGLHISVILGQVWEKGQAPNPVYYTLRLSFSHGHKFILPQCFKKGPDGEPVFVGKEKEDFLAERAKKMIKDLKAKKPSPSPSDKDKVKSAKRKKPSPSGETPSGETPSGETKAKRKKSSPSEEVGAKRKKPSPSNDKSEESPKVTPEDAGHAPSHPTLSDLREYASKLHPDEGSELLKHLADLLHGAGRNASDVLKEEWKLVIPEVVDSNTLKLRRLKEQLKLTEAEARLVHPNNPKNIGKGKEDTTAKSAILNVKVAKLREEIKKLENEIAERESPSDSDEPPYTL